MGVKASVKPPIFSEKRSQAGERQVFAVVREGFSHDGVKAPAAGIPVPGDRLLALRCGHSGCSSISMFGDMSGAWGGGEAGHGLGLTDSKEAAI
ncbi:MAG: hypothetical protein OXU61_04110 [Gammaproteobacteria bacterium]|nr:hypothetical protein [Gammaproteobacteria bacterium]